MGIDAAFKTSPFDSRATIVHQEMSVGFLNRLHASTRPLIMKHDMTERNVMFPHQISCKSCRAVNDGIQINSTILTHFDADRSLVSRVFEVSMTTLHIGGEMLHG